MIVSQARTSTQRANASQVTIDCVEVWTRPRSANQTKAAIANEITMRCRASCLAIHLMCRRQLIADGPVDASLRLDRVSPYQLEPADSRLTENAEVRMGESADIRQHRRQI